MTEPEDPTRLVDASSAPAGLRDALRAARADVGNDAQLARLARELGPLLGPPGVGGGAGAGTAVGAAGAAKLGAAALALVIAGGGAWLLSASNSPPRAAPPPALTQPEPAASIVAPSPVAAAPAPSSAATGAAPSKKPVDKLPTTLALSEAELLEQARKALKSEPARALALANEDAARYPRGALVQEREVIAVQALRRLGRDSEAERRAAAFGKAFPGSAYQRKLNASP